MKKLTYGSCFKNNEELLDNVLNFFKDNYNYDVSFLKAGYKNILTRSHT